MQQAVKARRTFSSVPPGNAQGGVYVVRKPPGRSVIPVRFSCSAARAPGRTERTASGVARPKKTGLPLALPLVRSPVEQLLAPVARRTASQSSSESGLVRRSWGPT